MIGLECIFQDYDSYGNQRPSERVIGVIVDKVTTKSLFTSIREHTDNFPQTAYVVKRSKPDYDGCEFKLFYPRQIISIVKEK